MTGIFFLFAISAVYLAPPLDLVSTTTTASDRAAMMSSLFKKAYFGSFTGANTFSLRAHPDSKIFSNNSLFP